MTRPKVRSTALLCFLDGHLGIAKGHALYPVAIFHIDHRLLFAIGCFALGNASGLVERYAFTFVRCHYFLAFFFFIFLKSAPVILFLGFALAAIFFCAGLSFFMLCALSECQMTPS